MKNFCHYLVSRIHVKISNREDNFLISFFSLSKSVLDYMQNDMKYRMTGWDFQLKRDSYWSFGTSFVETGYFGIGIELGFQKILGLESYLKSLLPGLYLISLNHHEEDLLGFIIDIDQTLCASPMLCSTVSVINP